MTLISLLNFSSTSSKKLFLALPILHMAGCITADKLIMLMSQSTLFDLVCRLCFHVDALQIWKAIWCCLATFLMCLHYFSAPLSLCDFFSRLHTRKWVTNWIKSDQIDNWLTLTRPHSMKCSLQFTASQLLFSLWWAKNKFNFFVVRFC